MHSEKVTVPLSEELFSEIKHLTEKEQNRLFYHLVKKHIDRKKREQLRAELKQGYIEMAKINLAISETFAYSEWEAFTRAEERKHHYS